MGKIPFVGPTYTLRSVNYDAQRCVNLYPVKSETGNSKDVVGLQGTPGLKTFINFDAAPPIPNLFVVGYQDKNDSLYKAKLYDVDNAYAPIAFDSTPFATASGIPYVRLSRDGSLFGVSTYAPDNPTQSFFLYDTRTLSQVPSYGSIPIINQPFFEQFAFSQTLIGFASDSGGIADFLIYDLATFSLQHSVNDGTGGYGQCIAFSPDGSKVALGSYSSTGAFNNIRVLNTSDWSSVTLGGISNVGKNNVQDLKFSPDGNYLAAVVKGATDGKILHGWDTATWTHYSVVSNSNVEAGSGIIMDLCWAPDSSSVLLAYVPNDTSQAIGTNPYVTWYLHVAVPGLAITYLYGTHVDGGGQRTYQDIINPVSWSQDGTTLFLTDATNNNLTTFNSAGTQNNILSLANSVVYSMTKKGDV